MEYTTIEVDFDIHKRIEAERRSFSEKPNDALRRLLGLPEAAPTPAAPTVPHNPIGRTWHEDGVLIPHGTLARMEYGRGSQVYEGQFLDGYLIVNGEPFKSLSAAAESVAKTKNGTTPSLNGWLYWQVKLPGSDRWELLDHKRKRAKGKAIF